MKAVTEETPKRRPFALALGSLLVLLALIALIVVLYSLGGDVYAG